MRRPPVLSLAATTSALAQAGCGENVRAPPERAVGMDVESAHSRSPLSPRPSGKRCSRDHLSGARGRH